MTVQRRSRDACGYASPSYVSAASASDAFCGNACANVSAIPSENVDVSCVSVSVSAEHENVTDCDADMLDSLSMSPDLSP